MEVHLDDESEVARSLERQVETQAEAAKEAIREYKKTIRHESNYGGVRQQELQREVQQAVGQYIQTLRELDELRERMTEGSLI